MSEKGEQTIDPVESLQQSLQETGNDQLYQNLYGPDRNEAPAAQAAPEESAGQEIEVPEVQPGPGDKLKDYFGFSEEETPEPPPEETSETQAPPEKVTLNGVEYTKEQAEAIVAQANDLNIQRNTLLQQQQSLNADAEEGRFLRNLRQTNPPLYEETVQFLKGRLNGTPAPKQEADKVGNALTELDSILESDEYREAKIDLTPFKKVRNVVGLVSGQQKEAIGALGEKLDAAMAQISELRKAKETFEAQTHRKRGEELSTRLGEMAGKTGVKIDPNSEDFKDLLSMFRSGRPLEKAFEKAYGVSLKEAKKVKKVVSTEEINPIKHTPGRTAVPRPGKPDKATQDFKHELYGPEINSVQSIFKK